MNLNALVDAAINENLDFAGGLALFIGGCDLFTGGCDRLIGGCDLEVASSG